MEQLSNFQHFSMKLISREGGNNHGEWIVTKKR